MDNFKKYLQQQNESMEFDEPSAKVWNNIAAAGSQKKTPVLRLIVRIAAAAAIIAAIAITGIQLAGKKETAVVAVNIKDPQVKLPGKIIADSGQPIVSTIVSPASQDTMAPPLKAMVKSPKKEDERYAMMRDFRENYGKLVSYQLRSIRSTAVYAEDPAYFDDFKTRLKQMDADELNIRNNIRRQGISNNLLEQLINVYQQKLDVLKSLQGEINKMNQRVQEQLPSDSMNKYYLSI